MENHTVGAYSIARKYSKQRSKCQNFTKILYVTLEIDVLWIPKSIQKCNSANSFIKKTNTIVSVFRTVTEIQILVDHYSK